MIDGNRNPPIMHGFFGLIRIGIQPTNGLCGRISISKESLFLWKACGLCVVWEKGD
jgi:hypothetical protein